MTPFENLGKRVAQARNDGDQTLADRLKYEYLDLVCAESGNDKIKATLEYMKAYAETRVVK